MILHKNLHSTVASGGRGGFFVLSAAKIVGAVTPA
jgi:hypothetical protein